MASCYLKQGNQFRVSSRDAMDLHDNLPVGNYVVKLDRNGFFLERIDPFSLPKKIYGGCDKDAERILSTFEDRTGTTGVLLCGEKGSGKTLTAKLVCSLAAKEGIPTIAIDAPYHGEAFNTFLQTIDQRSIILFDEFEKMYDSDDQEEILTLLDGVFNSTKLFLFTCNSKWNIDSHMRNRPGRVFYMIEFSGITEKFIREYCEDHLKDKSHTISICNLSVLFSQFNFDMLQAICEELNRYGGTMNEILRMLNVKPDIEGDTDYFVELTIDGKQLTKTDTYNEGNWQGNPLGEETKITYLGEKSWITANFTPDDIKSIDSKSGSITLENASDQKAILKRKYKMYKSFGRLI